MSSPRVCHPRLDASVRPGAVIACAPSLGGCRRPPVSSYDFLGQRLHRPATCLRAPACHTLVACPALPRHPWQQASPPHRAVSSPDLFPVGLPVLHGAAPASPDFVLCVPAAPAPPQRPAVHSLGFFHAFIPAAHTDPHSASSSTAVHVVQLRFFASSLSTSYGSRHRHSPVVD